MFPVVLVPVPNYLDCLMINKNLREIIVEWVNKIQRKINTLHILVTVHGLRIKSSH